MDRDTQPKNIFNQLDPLPFATRTELPHPDKEVQINIDQYVFHTHPDTKAPNPQPEVQNPQPEVQNPQPELAKPSQQEENPDPEKINQGQQEGDTTQKVAEKEAKTKKAAQEEATKKEGEEKKATEQKEAKKRKVDFLLAEEEWLYARAKESIQDLWNAEYIDEDISEPACTSLLNRYLERR